MVIRPINSTEAGGAGPSYGAVHVHNSLVTTQRSMQAAYVPAWSAVARKQGETAEQYWMVSQPDHAELAGALARNFRSHAFACLEENECRAIEVHDVGWRLFAWEHDLNVDPPRASANRPLSFLEVGLHDFLRAWTASVEQAEQISPVAGIMVSSHFYRLGYGRLDSGQDIGDDARRLHDFLIHEAERQRRLAASITLKKEQIQCLVDCLQFCDLLSLYLCSGATDAVEFPQQFGGNRVRMRNSNGAFLLDPSPFAVGDGDVDSRPVSLAVAARKFPRGGKPETTTIPFLLS